MSVSSLARRKVRLSEGIKLVRGTMFELQTVRVWRMHRGEEDCPSLLLCVNLYNPGKGNTPECSISVRLDQVIDAVNLEKRTGETFAEALARRTTRLSVELGSSQEDVEFYLYFGKRIYYGSTPLVKKLKRLLKFHGLDLDF